MAVKIPLRMPDGPVYRIEQLRDSFDMSSVLEAFRTGQLCRWLEDHGYKTELGKISDLAGSACSGPELRRELCTVLGVGPGTWPFDPDRLLPSDGAEITVASVRNKTPVRLKDVLQPVVAETEKSFSVAEAASACWKPFKWAVVDLLRTKKWHKIDPGNPTLELPGERLDSIADALEAYMHNLSRRAVQAASSAAHDLEGILARRLEEAGRVSARTDRPELQRMLRQAGLTIDEVLQCLIDPDICRSVVQEAYGRIRLDGVLRPVTEELWPTHKWFVDATRQVRNCTRQELDTILEQARSPFERTEGLAREGVCSPLNAYMDGLTETMRACTDRLAQAFRKTNGACLAALA